MGTGDRPARGGVEPAPGTWQPPGPHDLYYGPTTSRVWREAIAGGALPCSGYARVEGLAETCLHLIEHESTEGD